MCRLTHALCVRVQCELLKEERTPLPEAGTHNQVLLLCFEARSLTLLGVAAAASDGDIMTFREKLPKRSSSSGSPAAASKSAAAKPAAAPAKSSAAAKPAAADSTMLESQSRTAGAAAAVASQSAALDAGAAANSAGDEAWPRALLALCSFGAGVLITSLVRCAVDRRESIRTRERLLKPLLRPDV